MHTPNFACSVLCYKQMNQPSFNYDSPGDDDDWIECQALLKVQKMLINLDIGMCYAYSHFYHPTQCPILTQNKHVTK